MFSRICNSAEKRNGNLQFPPLKKSRSLATKGTQEFPPLKKIAHNILSQSDNASCKLAL